MNPSNGHEAVIGGFYTDSPYPWRAHTLQQPLDPGLYPALLSQAVGDFDHRRIAPDGAVWVAGCGVNQALITAQRHPSARVVGTDVSEGSLALCDQGRKELGLDNLELRQEGLTAARYHEEFDYIVCTGVLHHNPDPSALLQHLAAALRPTGVLEVMVYNTYHRRNPVAFQQATRLLAADTASVPSTGRALADALDLRNSLAGDLAEARLQPDAAFTDTWLNPYELTFTVEEFRALAERCGLLLEAPRTGPHDDSGEAALWDVVLHDAALRERYEACDDHTRWRIAQLLLAEESPYNWFYLRRADAPLPASSDTSRNAAFLAARAAPVAAAQRTWALRGAEGYRVLVESSPLPVMPVAPEFRALWEHLTPEWTIGQTCTRLGLPTDPQTVRRMRAQLTTPEFPYVLSVPA
ncbi:class I SAM-dependent methyltransferase [Streptomyces sp. 1331.2]|uniref:class I SAM-dependent methyltransferase n=1 Tax=Streptomyces sp. 1331.2 TaxID=1938835 RepID=UPI000BDAA7A8|nr:class I SAM-dependent methyltransferase [Streptomyces sp. 1331.2]SOB88725.1 Methyltransferase domain-containing protein [Streptomyces sp. 1331.2]